MAMKKCPVCGVSVKAENLERHVRDQHPRERVDLSAALTQEDRRELRERRAKARPAITRTGKRILAAVSVGIAIVLVLVILNPFAVGPGVGQVAPDFTLQRSDGGSLTLSASRGSVVFLEFMDVDCSACIAEASSVLPSLHLDYSPRGVVFISVSVIDVVPPPDTTASVETFKATYGTSWPYVMDFGRSARNAYQITATPTTFILNADGVITAKFVGRAPGGYAGYAAALDAAGA